MPRATRVHILNLYVSNVSHARAHARLCGTLVCARLQADDALACL